MIARQHRTRRQFKRSLGAVRPMGAECQQLEARALLTAVHLADYFPLANGNSWAFTGTYGTPAVSATATQTSTANITEQGRLVTVLDQIITSGGKTREEKSYFAHTAYGLKLFRTDTIGSNTTITHITGGATELPPDPVIGTPYTFTKNLTGTISNGLTFTGTTSGTVTLVGFSPLTTGDGTYAALQETISQTFTNHLSNGSTTTGTTTRTEWLIKGIGYGAETVLTSSTNTLSGASSKTYNITLSDTPLATADPRLQVYGGSVKIPSGDTHIKAADHTGFGPVDVNGGTRGWNYILTNTGAQTLHISSINITGANAGDFTIVTQPAHTTLNPGASTSFRIRFDPSGAGLRNATVTITSDSAADNTYTFAIRGTGVLLGGIGVTGGTGHTTIHTGAITTNTTDGTRFGSALTVGPHTIAKTYTITDTGPGTLNLLGNPLVQITGADAGDFTVTALPHSSVVTGDSTSFTITFNPQVAGFRKAFVTIVTNDPAHPLFTFAIAGTGQ